MTEEKPDDDAVVGARVVDFDALKAEFVIIERAIEEYQVPAK
jgi:hypothetical protein